MINNNNDITKYTNYNKIYIPTQYVNNQYRYYINGDYIIIIKNTNCYQNYNTTYCDCNYYNYKNNLMSEQSSCNAYPNNYQINYNNITDNINYSSYISNKFFQEKITMTGIFIIGLVITILLTKEIRY